MTTKSYRDRFFLEEDNAPVHYKTKQKKFNPDFPFDRKQKDIGRVIYDTQNFKCRNCGFFVTQNRELSGVNNRNHCPRCLWSRHMDITPGDRKSDCLSRMEPVGLTVKHVNKKYGCAVGELMVIHVCTCCGKVSINRIAADDDPDVIHTIFNISLEMPLELRERLTGEAILLLQHEERQIVRRQLYGLPDLAS
ncbi:MAG: RNHCP domain-containing protein [Chloroflexi bacterium]|nr:RNHCP domain-containing protein [Chloroflexota bacterium]